LVLGAINAMLASDDTRPPQRELDVRPAVKHPARAREKPSRRVAVQPREDPRSVIRRALLAADELHTRTKAAGAETLTARETALEQA
jgi:hypothetical protein